ncbi:MAG: excinuclease ABC subunit UvrA [Bacteroidales bacterium]
MTTFNNTTQLSNIIEPENSVYVEGARVHNLQNISVHIPHNALTVITGLSGSGKSSLAFDTIYAEGQRRYIETFSAYARQFLGTMERPDVDKITGLSPVISIEQKTVNRNPRSTVGTVTEIYDFLRLLYARIGEAYSYNTGERMIKYTPQKILTQIQQDFNSKKILLLAPVVQGRKGHYKELFESFRKKGYLHARINGEIRELTYGLKLDRYKTHFIEIVIDKCAISENAGPPRLKESLNTAMKQGKGVCLIIEKDATEGKYYSKNLMCPTTGLSYKDPAPHSFSFNSPQGACERCNGLGVIHEIDIQKIIPDTSLSIAKGAIKPLGELKKNLIFCKLEAIAEKYDFSLKTPFSKISEKAQNIILYGSQEMFTFKNTPLGIQSNHFSNFEGIIEFVEKNNLIADTKHTNIKQEYLTKVTCPVCNGQRLKKEFLHYKLADKNISDISNFPISDLYSWITTLPENLSSKQHNIAVEIIKEIQTRLTFLLDVGLHYLNLNRESRTLSGGESQRIRLATQIGSKLVNVLYILDEPSIGLHQRDNEQLITALKELRDNDNSIIVVEHDKDMILAADYVIDIGPYAGKHGGNITAQGTPKEFISQNSLTGEFLNGTKTIPIPKKRRKGNKKKLTLEGASGNNLKNVDITIPLGTLTCVTGVSGSGKSTLINQTLHPILNQHFYRSKKNPLPYTKIKGIEHVNKVIEIDQSPIGRTPRSNPVTYTNIFSDIRKLYEQLPESKMRGYKAGRFSFNIKGGRCETCKGAGVKTIEMNFLPDVYVTCDECYGHRYNRETLEVRFKGKSISDVLNMTVNQAVDFFENIPHISHKLQTIQNVGLGYITLGQSSTTLSGGEAQRIKLAAELQKKDTGDTLYILDEPTTGLHFHDINVLLHVIQNIVNKGNTVIIIEHNLDVIKTADYIIDVGPEGGKNGGEIICTGTPEKIISHTESYTAKFLKNELDI